MSNLLREKLADLVIDGIDKVHDMDVTHDDYAWSAADAILAAMPEIVRGMIKPLVWDGFISGPYEIIITDSGIANLFCHSIHDEDWNPENICGGYLTHVSVDDLKQEANDHHQDAILSALSTQGEG